MRGNMFNALKGGWVELSLEPGERMRIYDVDGKTPEIMIIPPKQIKRELGIPPEEPEEPEE